jgi:hypothetical protein
MGSWTQFERHVTRFHKGYVVEFQVNSDKHFLCKMRSLGRVFYVTTKLK